jgi:hypothetical protein
MTEQAYKNADISFDAPIGPSGPNSNVIYHIIIDIKLCLDGPILTEQS